MHPRTGELWASVNERDELGDNLVPDYITHVEDGGFYGWPWYYIGGNQDPRHKGKHPELKDKAIVPDVLLQPHCASLRCCSTTASSSPLSTAGDIFAAQHGSWNRAGAHRLQGDPRPDARDAGDRRVRGLPVGFVTADGRGLGTAGRRRGREGRRAAGDRRRFEFDLARQLRGATKR